MEYQKDATISSAVPKVDPKNPHGLGDPNDRSLRKVEVEVLIPKIMRDRAKAEHCLKEVKAFESCCRDNSLLMVINCRQQNDVLKTCLANWYSNEAFKAECKEIYLKERSEYRATGIPKKHRMARL
ncbi:COX assembly mitochondrial protein homolog [Episyrphus balteatus]|uniref:COX assembly mitochondrial protein homolog n=1 Tax=Episyrphus balteatus TaxID=286459 RepID=UPI0024851D14|nr:COX assembly mitochondrial protein homolog [Episyrphus balteatus]